MSNYIVTPAKKWASLRNHAKFRLSGAYKHIENLSNDHLLTKGELIKLAVIRFRLNQLIKQWERGNAKSKQIWMEK